MLKRTLVALALLCGLIPAVPAQSAPAGVPQAKAQALPWAGYKRVFFDDFLSLDQRVSNPSGSLLTRDLDNGSGTWTTFPYYAPDAKGSNGLGQEFWLNQGYLCGGVNYDRISVSGGVLSISTLPTPAACTSAGISKPYLSAILTTYDSWLVRDRFVACAKAKMSGVTGTIDAPVWSITRPPGRFPLDGTRPRYEVDGGEQPGYNRQGLTHAILGDYSGSYESSVGNTPTQDDLANGFHIYCQKVEQGRVQFYVDGRLAREVTASTNWATTNRWHYLLIDLGLDTNPGTLFGSSNSYTGTAATLKVDWIAAWVPRDYVPGRDYLDWRTPDGEGADLMEDDPSQTSFVANCFWYDQSTTTTVGTALVEPDEIKPSVVPSNGAVWQGREGGCNSPKGVVNGTTYTATWIWGAGTSPSFGAYLIPGCTGNTVNITVTGGVATVASGTATNVRVSTDLLTGLNVLKASWNPGCTGNWTTRFTPNSTTVGQTILAYRMMLRH